MTRVLVLGGGFGGLAAANVLRQRLDDEAEVVLAAQNDRFAMGFAKLWDLAGMRPIGAGTRSLHDLHERGIRFVHAQVTGIDPDRCTVDTTAGTFEADGLVVALGSRPAPDHRAWLDASGGHDLYDPAALPAMREALASIERGRVVVSILGGPFKCPPAPYEAALIVDRLLRDRGVRDDVEVVVTTPQPMSLPAAGVDASRYVADHLGDQGIVLRSGTKVAAVDGASREIALVPASPTSDAEPGRLAFDVLLGVPADAPLPVVADSGLGDDAGWVRPDRHTLRTDRERVYAIGDATVIPTAAGALPHAGVFAAAQGEVAARNLVADLTGDEPSLFDGHGYCFLELPDEQVAYVAGDFYADPMDVALTPADHEQFRRKQAYERDRLAAWFGH
jgi:sulfide:quinone oxidoreductase